MALPKFTSLKLELKNYVDNPYSSRTLAPQTREILEFAYEQVQLSEQIARKILLSSTSRLDFQIRVAVSKLLRKMYALREMNITNSIMHIEFPMDQLVDLKHHTESFAAMLENMAAEFPVDDKDDKVTISSRIHKPKMVGLNDQYEHLKDRLTHTGLVVPFTVVLIGMPGIGKTTLANKIFEDPSIVAHYNYRLWVTVGRKCAPVEIPRRVLAAVDPNFTGGDDKEVSLRLREKLKGKRYLIVLDDVWNRYMACHFRFYSKYNSFGSDPFPFPLEADKGLVLCHG